MGGGGSVVFFLEEEKDTGLEGARNFLADLGFIIDCNASPLSISSRSKSSSTLLSSTMLSDEDDCLSFNEATLRAWRVGRRSLFVGGGLN